MKEVVISPYAVSCPTSERESGGIFYGASSVPCSRTLKYIPRIPESHRYGLKVDCADAFMIPIIWKGERKDTELYRMVFHKLMRLPLDKGSKVVYMARAEGFFFDLRLKGGVVIKLTQYEDDREKGAYVNVILDDQVLVQDFMPIDDLVSAMEEFYDGADS